LNVFTSTEDTQRPIFLEKDQRITTHKMMYKGEETVKPLRKTMKKLAQVAHHEKYCEETRRGKLISASDETHWGIVGQRNGGRTADGGTPYDRSRQTHHWLMTKPAFS
jgi:hypothetical protein